ncbi:MAG: shikimate dehydrogenase, partial [Chloroflexi bacterium]|nr:shikimate dehydrogenase [Chloroflexota bacterium]
MAHQQEPFAFIIHPIDPKSDVARKYPLLGKMLTEGQINFFSRFFPPVYISEIHGIQSAETGRELTGWFIACPFTPKTMLKLPVEAVYNKIVACGHMAERLGARLLGLGAYTSVVGDAGETIAQRLEIPVTNGDAYTVYMALEAVREAARQMDIRMSDSVAAVVGATGVIGRVCAQILAREVSELILVGRRSEALDAVREECEGHRAHLKTGLDMSQIAKADL